MKRINYLPIAILAMAPVTAFAHKVPYGASHCAVSEEQAEFEEIPLCTQEEKEKSAAVAFCKFTGRPDLANCAESIVFNGLSAAAGKCVDEAMAKYADEEDDLVSHKVGKTSPTSNDGYWHTDYKYSKEDGWHRHDWSEDARILAGRKHGADRVRDAKDSSSNIKTTTGSSSSFDWWGDLKVKLGLAGGSLGGVEQGVGVKGTSGKTTSTEKGPISDDLAKQMYEEGFHAAYADPNLANVNPNIMCERDKPKCSSSFSRNIVNEDYKPEGNKTTDNQSSGGSGNGNKSGSTSGNQSGANNNPAPQPDKTSSDLDAIEYTPSGSYAGDPSPVTKPGEMIASWDQDQMSNNPVSRCMMETFKEQVSKDMNKTYDPNRPNLTPEQRRQEAQGLLRKGICDSNYFGSAFCQRHKLMKLTTTKAQDVPEEDKSDFFQELQELGKYNFGNPADYQDRTPIDFSRIPKTDPNTPSLKPIVVPKVN